MTRQIWFHISEDKATVNHCVSENIRVTAIEFIGGAKVSLIALQDAVDQIQYIYPDVDWYFVRDPSVSPGVLVAHLLPIQV